MRSFQARPREHSNYYFRVIIFPSQREMRAYERSVGAPCPQKYDALTICHSDRRWLLGELLFTVQQLTPELIAHEAAHAADWYARRVRRRDGETIAAAGAKIAADIIEKTKVTV